MPYEIIEDDGYVQPFTNIEFPIIRRVHPTLIVNSLVSIQPMSLPSSSIFYIDYVYGGEGVIIEEMENTMDGKEENVKEIFMKYIGKKQSEILKKVVVEKFPQYKELLEKLLVLA